MSRYCVGQSDDEVLIGMANADATSSRIIKGQSTVLEPTEIGIFVTMISLKWIPISTPQVGFQL